MPAGATTLAHRILMILGAAPYALSWAELRRVAGVEADRDLLDAAETLVADGLLETRRGMWAIAATAPGAEHWARVAGDAAFGAARLRRDVPDEVGLALSAAGPEESDVAGAAWRMLVIAQREQSSEDTAALLRVLATVPDRPPRPRSRPARLAARVGMLPPAPIDLARRRARLKRLFDRVGSP